MNRRRRADLFLVVAFLAALGLPLLTASYRPLLFATEAQAQDWARPGMDGWERWRQGFGHEFGGRGWLLSLERRLKLDVLDASPSDDVIVGQDGWLFLGRYQGYDGMADYLRTSPFSPEELQTWVDHFRTKQEALARASIPYTIVFAPNKHSIYPENMPAGLSPCARPSRMAVLIGALRAAGLDVVDLSPPLLAAKNEHRVYYRTDTHWNWGGAVAAYQAVIDHLHERFPTMAVLSGQWDGEETGVQGNLAVISGVPDRYPEDNADPLYRPALSENGQMGWNRDHGIDTLHPVPQRWVEHAVVRVDRPAAQMERGLIIGDSFLHYGFGPLLAQHFRESERVFSHTLDMSQVGLLHPQLVLEEMVEEDLTLPPPHPLLQ